MKNILEDEGKIIFLFREKKKWDCREQLYSVSPAAPCEKKE